MPAIAAATAAAGEDALELSWGPVLSTSMPRPLPVPQRPPELLLLRPSRPGVLPVGAARMLSIRFATAGGAGDLMVRGLPMLPPMPLSAAFIGLPTLMGLRAPPKLAAAPAADGDPGSRLTTATAPPPLLLPRKPPPEEVGCVRMGDRCTGRPAAAAAAAAHAVAAGAASSAPPPLLLPPAADRSAPARR